MPDPLLILPISFISIGVFHYKIQRNQFIEKGKLQLIDTKQDTLNGKKATIPPK